MARSRLNFAFYLYLYEQNTQNVGELLYEHGVYQILTYFGSQGKVVN